MAQMKNKRSALFTWNEETDRQINELTGGYEQPEEDLDTRQEQIPPKQSPSGVVKAVEPRSPVSKSYSDENEELENSVIKIKREREQMLAMIKANQKMSYKEADPVAKQPSATRSRVEILAGLGGDIISGLEESIYEKKKAPSEEGTPEKETTKKVTFLEESQYTESEQQSLMVSNFKENHDRKSSNGGVSSEKSDNKLADLNNILKSGGNFNIKDEDENEFEAFMKQL